MLSSFVSVISPATIEMGRKWRTALRGSHCRTPCHPLTARALEHRRGVIRQRISINAARTRLIIDIAGIVKSRNRAFSVVRSRLAVDGGAWFISASPRRLTKWCRISPSFRVGFGPNLSVSERKVHTPSSPSVSWFKLLISAIDCDELTWNNKSNIISTVDDCSLLRLLRHRFNPTSMSSECDERFSTRVHPP